MIHELIMKEIGESIGLIEKPTFSTTTKLLTGVGAIVMVIGLVK